MKLSTSQRKKFRVRNQLKKYSSVNRYRLTVSRSSKNISAQIIDDLKKITLLSATSNQKSLKNIKKTKSEVSTIVAENLAKKAKELKINKIYFRPAEVELLIADYSKIQTKIGWKPKVGIDKLIEKMVLNDLKLLKD